MHRTTKGEDETHSFSSRSVKIHVHPRLLLAQSRLGLLHVLRDRVVADELLRFRLVVSFGRVEEGFLECFSVHVEILSASIRFVQSQCDYRSSYRQLVRAEYVEVRRRRRTKRVDDFFDEIRFDSLSVSLILDELEDGGGELRLGLDVLVEMILPLNERQLSFRVSLRYVGSPQRAEGCCGLRSATGDAGRVRTV